MSGRPNLAGIKSLQQSLRDFAWTRDSINELKNSIHEQQKTLELRESELGAIQLLIRGKLDEMDVSSPRNAGWEQRYLELLLLMSQI